MTDRVLLDTGPLVAMFSKHDEHHQACVGAFDLLFGPPMSCLPVITEAVYLLRSNPLGQRKLLALIETQAIELVHLPHKEVALAGVIMQKYKCDFADACLLVLAQRMKARVILTLDQRHFRAFGRDVGGPFTLLPER